MSDQPDRAHSVPSLSELEQAAPFRDRHIGPSHDDRAKMVAVVGRGSLDELVDEAVPASIRLDTALALPAPRTEAEVLAELHALAARNRRMVQMIGLGYSDAFTPMVVLRKVVEQGGTLITTGDASAVPVEFGLVDDITVTRTSGNFYAPGPIVTAKVLRPANPIFYG